MGDLLEGGAMINADVKKTRVNVLVRSSGLLLGKMGERGAPLVNVCQCINECVMKIINAAVW